MFSVVAILMVLSSLWLGLNLANSIVNPLVRVISAADEVRAGNWRTRVEENDDVDEISRLGTSFNRMLDELSSSREQLVQANHQLDARREFTEAVLGGVSSGVIGMDRNTKITLPNGAACDILKTSQQSLFGKKLSDAVPEFAVLLKDIHAVGKSKDAVKSQIELSSQGRRIIVLVQITKETVEGRLVGYVLTFDDITDLLSAQRKAAWADVARRIAHEIKNPLTPITLATDRLIKKYMPDDAAEQDRFREYVSIISRQVDDIGRMVDEFSKFARMPSPVFKQLDLYKLVTEHKLLFASSEQQTVKIEIEQIDSPIMVEADAGLMRQMLTNILKNASESMVEAGIGAPLIKIGFDRRTAGAITVRIADTGPGFSGSQLEQYLEPYVTTRDKGTGLGLAIVQKIIMEHKGAIELANHPEGGGMVNITLPLISVETTA